MSEWQPGRYDDMARKWLALAERRRAHLIELRSSGRWKHYIAESELDAQLLELDLARGRFAKILGLKIPGLELPNAAPETAAEPAEAVVVSLESTEAVARSQPHLSAAIEAALSAALALQESAEKSAA
jgi:hypothetical protein